MKTYLFGLEQDKGQASQKLDIKLSTSAVNAPRERMHMQVVVIGRLLEKLQGALAGLKAAGYEPHGALTEAEAMALIYAAERVFAVVCGGAVDDATQARIAHAAKLKGALMFKVSLAGHEPEAYFRDHVLPRLEKARTAREAARKITPRIAVVAGSVRAGRFARTVAEWALDLLAERGDVETELLDLRDYEMPFFDDSHAPMRKTEPYTNEAVERWSRAVGAAHGFLMVAPEYNHGPTAVLKNAIDWVYREWAGKPVTFASYGLQGGARAVEQLRLVALEVQLVPLPSAIHLPVSMLSAHAEGNARTELIPFESRAERTLDQLVQWTTKLSPA
ncbi:MAG: nadph-dependent fmn reductase [Myxococcaceae bacterium]|nr:nadph-dependent fmn reductase [Myxococcaceae bacterium]